MGGGYY
jgi:hypothetical protein